MSEKSKIRPLNNASRDLTDFFFSNLGPVTLFFCEMFLSIQQCKSGILREILRRFVGLKIGKMDSIDVVEGRSW